MRESTVRRMRMAHPMAMYSFLRYPRIAHSRSRNQTTLHDPWQLQNGCHRIHIGRHAKVAKQETITRCRKAAVDQPTESSDTVDPLSPDLSKPRRTKRPSPKLSARQRNCLLGWQPCYRLYCHNFPEANREVLHPSASPTVAPAEEEPE